MLIKFRHFFSVLLCQTGLSKYASMQWLLLYTYWMLYLGSLMLPGFYLCQIAARFLKPDKKTADLVGNTKMKASTNVRHIVLPCTSSARAQLIPDIIRCYSRWFYYSMCFFYSHMISVSSILNFNVHCWFHGSGSVEAGQLFLPRQKNLLLSLQGSWLEQKLSMVTYSNQHVRWAITWILV